jgi:hypothetical protein
MLRRNIDGVSQARPAAFPLHLQVRPEWRVSPVEEDTTQRVVD